MYMADPSALARTSLTRKIQLSVWYGRMLSGTETVRFDASEVRVSSSVAQSLPVISTTPVVHEARAAGWRQRRLSARSFYHTRAPGSTGWSPRRRQEEAGTKAVTPVLLAPISMSSKTHVRD